MQGLHLTADLHGCDPARAPMTDTAALRALCAASVERCGLQPVGEVFHRFASAAGGAAHGGVTGVVLLAESHVAVHTWPEQHAVTLDVYVCNVGADNSAKAATLLGALADAFAPQHVERHELRRGTLPRA